MNEAVCVPQSLSCQMEFRHQAFALLCSVVQRCLPGGGCFLSFVGVHGVSLPHAAFCEMNGVSVMSCKINLAEKTFHYHKEYNSGQW